LVAIRQGSTTVATEPLKRSPRAAGGIGTRLLIASHADILSSLARLLDR